MGGSNAATSTHEGMAPPSSSGPDHSAKIALVLRLLLIFNFFIAPVKDGLAPLVSVFLVAVKGWDPGTAGVIWFARDAAAIVCQTFVGVLVDVSERKRALLVLATVVTSASAISVVWNQNFAFLLVKSLVEGVAVCVIQPCKNALVLGLIGQERFDQVSRVNEMADHSGSFCAIFVAGAIAFLMYPNVVGVFYVVGGGGLLACLALILMPLSVPDDPDPDDDLACSERPDPLNDSTRSLISQNSSRNLSEAEGSAASSFRSILIDRNIALFALSTFFFHLGNAAVLPLLSQVLAIDGGRAGLPFTCANIAIAQTTSVFAAWGMGRALEKNCPYKLPLIVGYVSAVPVRCGLILILLHYFPNEYALMATQLLDGIGAGTFGLSLPTVTSALTVGTGRFSFVFSLVVTMWMAGAALSNLLSGYLVTFTSYSAGFAALGVVGLPSVFLAACIRARPPQEEVPTELNRKGVFRPRGVARTQEEDLGKEEEQDEGAMTLNIATIQVVNVKQTKYTINEEVNSNRIQRKCDEETCVDDAS